MAIYVSHISPHLIFLSWKQKEIGTKFGETFFRCAICRRVIRWVIRWDLEESPRIFEEAIGQKAIFLRAKL